MRVRAKLKVKAEERVVARSKGEGEEGKGEGKEGG